MNMDIPETKNHILQGMTRGLKWENIVMQRIRSIERKWIILQFVAHSKLIYKHL